jgi:glutamate dehydrogenase
VAGVHVALDTQLGLARLRVAVDALARGERWSALAREALRDDLASAQRALVEGVLATAGDGDGDDARDDGPAARTQAWLAAHHLAVGRFLRLQADLEGAEVGLATLSVVLRELRALALGPGTGAAPAPSDGP